MSTPAVKRRRLAAQRYESRRRDLLTLPQEVVFHVFSFLEAADLTTCARVSTKWYEAANDDHLWKPLYLVRFSNPRQLLVQQLRSQRLHSKLATGSQTAALSTTATHSIDQRLDQRRNKWKNLYKVNHNWETGNCQVDELALPLKEERSLLDQTSNETIIQICHDMMATTWGGSSVIDIWQIHGSHIEHISKAGPSTVTSAYVTCIKWDTLDTRRVIVGYSNGGFSIYQVDARERLVQQLAYYAARPSVSCDRHCVKSITLCDSMVMTCSTDMELSTYTFDEQGNTRFCHCLTSAMHWEPLTIEVYSKGDQTYQAVVCFGMSVGLDSWTIGLQEIIFTANLILNSRHSSSRLPPGHGLLDRIQKISYAHPYVVTSHKNNTMQQYRIVTEHGKRIEIEHVRTLWGHTNSVGAMAMDARIGRLVSGDRAGIKVWNLESPRELVVGIESGFGERMEWIGFDSEKIVTVAGDHENNVKVWSFSSSNK
ncbi:hypothetical protein NQZ79_g4320 [Umbelopsis isabellina]|nr:hypothetical protein NQZ79_g4320 [Umbelopsis isabellina]